MMPQEVPTEEPEEKVDEGTIAEKDISPEQYLAQLKTLETEGDAGASTNASTSASTSAATVKHSPIKNDSQPQDNGTAESSPLKPVSKIVLRFTEQFD